VPRGEDQRTDDRLGDIGRHRHPNVSRSSGPVSANAAPEYANRCQDVEGEQTFQERTPLIAKSRRPKQDFVGRVLNPEASGRDRELACGRDRLVRDRKEREWTK
jgi:hypothetical protein